MNEVVDVVAPLWPAPERLPKLQAFTTTQQTAWSDLVLPSPPQWLEQVHGTTVIDLADWSPRIQADGAFTEARGRVAVVKTADCLPILLAGNQPPWVAAVHAGWRGLAAGVVDAAVVAYPGDPSNLQAWIGPAISQGAYEVDDEVYQAFVGKDRLLVAFFAPSRSGHWWADLPGIAKKRLEQLGILQVALSGLCTAGEPDRFYSYRHAQARGRETGRMASLIWLE